MARTHIIHKRRINGMNIKLYRLYHTDGYGVMMQEATDDIDQWRVWAMDEAESYAEACCWYNWRCIEAHNFDRAAEIARREASIARREALNMSIFTHATRIRDLTA